MHCPGNNMSTMASLLVLVMIWWVLSWWFPRLIPSPKRPIGCLLRILGRGLWLCWLFMYKKPAEQRGAAFGIFWLLCCLWVIMLLVTIHQGCGWIALTVFLLVILGYRWVLAKWHQATSPRRTLPHRGQWA